MNRTFQYKFTGRSLRQGDLVDGAYRNQFIYDATVIRPQCLEYGYDDLNDRGYMVEVRAGKYDLLLRRGDISNVRRPYQVGDWAD